MRSTRVIRDVAAGCDVCDAHWESPNAQAVAAHHTDATGHDTWVHVKMDIFYRASPSVAPATP